MSEKLKEIIENMPKDVLINSFETVYEDSIKKYLEIERLNNIIKEARELVENGTDFKSIYFKKDKEDLWKVILANEIKEKYLEILKGSDKE